MPSLNTVAVFCGTLLFLYLLHQVVLHPLSVYPGPIFAKLTYFWRVFVFFRGSSHLADAELHRKYGPVVRDGPNSLLVADVAAFKSIYGFNNTMEKGDFYLSTANKKSHHPAIFAARTEAQHREARSKVVPPALTARSLTEYEPFITRNVCKFREQLKNKLTTCNGEVDIAPAVDYLTFDAMLETMYGSSLGFIDAGYDMNGTIAEKTAIFQVSTGPSMIPWLARLLATRIINSRIVKPKFQKTGEPKGITAPLLFSEARLEKACKNPADIQPSVLRSLLLVREDDKRKPEIDIVRHECFNAVFAGTGSTAAALLAVLYEIARHPQWMSALQSDIGDLPRDQRLDNAYLLKLPRLQAVIKESLRLHPPFGAPFERIVGAGGELSIPNMKGPIPKGTRVWSSLYVICGSKEVFGEDAESFEPKRWLSSDPSRRRTMEDMFCVFGRGSRICIGRDIAWMIIQKAIAAIITKWDIHSSVDALKGHNGFEMRYTDMRLLFSERSLAL